MPMIPCPDRTNRQRGFTLVELIMIIVILGILSATVHVRWPVGMEEEAAAKEFKRAIRYAQHKAMTRQYDDKYGDPNRLKPWGITIADNRYSVQRLEEDCTINPETKEGCAEADYLARLLLNDNTMTLTGGPVWFNGLGEPIDPITGAPVVPVPPDLIAASFTIAGTKTVTVSPRTGYVQ